MKATILLTTTAALLAATSNASAAPLGSHIDTFFDDERPMLVAEQTTVPAQVAGANPLHAAVQSGSKAGRWPGDRGAREAATHGSGPLRRFITRTEGIYQLRYDQYLRP
jgi:hypothetical protein